jgi:hypothetical protein
MLVKAERPMPQFLPFPLSALADSGAWRLARTVAAGCTQAAARFMTAVHETRRHEAARTLAHHRHLVETAGRESLDRPGSAP